MSTVLSPPSLTLYFDGSCFPNPGKMRIGVYCPETNYRYSAEVGRGTNNVAELLAAEHAARYLRDHLRKGETGELVGDSKIAVFAASGKWKLSAPHLRTHRAAVREVLQNLPVSCRLIPRDMNAIADGLATGKTKTKLARGRPKKYRQ